MALDRYGRAVDWDEPSWWEGVTAWIGAAVQITGPITAVHEHGWSRVLRVPTDDGTAWFKATIDFLRHEAPLLALLHSAVPHTVPVVLGVDAERGWLLTADAGVALRTVVERERSLDRWAEVLTHYSHLQRAVEDQVDNLLALGVPDLRLARLPERYAELVDAVGSFDPRLSAAIPRVTEMCEELASFGITETLQHDDLHDGQVFVDSGHYRIIDWGDAVVSHPFCTLSVTLEGVIQWGLDDVEGSVDTAPFRDAYLRAFGSPRSLARAAELATRLGWAARAVATHAAGGEEPERIRTRLRMFLDGRPR